MVADGFPSTASTAFWTVHNPIYISKKNRLNIFVSNSKLLEIFAHSTRCLSSVLYVIFWWPAPLSGKVLTVLSGILNWDAISYN